EVGADDVPRQLVVVGTVEDPDAAGGGQATVADQAVVSDPDVVVVVAVHERLTEADAAGEDAAVVLDHVVGQLLVVDAGLQLDAARAVAVPGHQAEAVDPGAAEAGTVTGHGRHVVCGRRSGIDGDVSTAEDDTRGTAREGRQDPRVSSRDRVEA